MALAREAQLAAASLVRAESALSDVRRAHAAALADSAIAAIATRNARDSLAMNMARLTQRLLRASSTPLSESYRALASDPLLARDARTRQLVDTLDAIERQRLALGGGATVGPVFVALSARRNTVGRSLQRLATTKLDSLRAELRTLPVQSQPVSPLGAVAPADSSAARAEVDSGQRALQRVTDALALARRANLMADSLTTRAQDRSGLASVPALAGAALVLSLFLAFVLAYSDEMRSPRVSDAVEAERLTGLRVLSRIGRSSISSERARRAADRTLAQVLDPTADEYRMIAWHLAAEWPRDGIVTVTGDDPFVTARVGANVASVLANDARVTLLIDTHFSVEPVRLLLDLPRSPGVAAVVDNKRRWSESVIPVTVGRSRTLDVLPSGTRQRALGPAESQALVAEIARAARRYDAAVVVASTTTALRSRAGDHVILCATEGHTRLATLGRAVSSLIDAGARIRGIVLWTGNRRTHTKGVKS